jgi:hypothetical protein
MLDTFLVFSAGLLVGWNVLPQPAWCKALWDKFVAKFKK